MPKETEIGVFETKTHLSELIQRVMAGERFVITRRGQRVAELRPVETEKRPLQRGCARNDGYRMAPDFDAPLVDMEEYM
jgi:prevent-host-death family protein